MFRSALALVPGKHAFLRCAARLPPTLRWRQSYRLASALARRWPPPEHLMVTNMGISPTLACTVPARDHIVLYGKPSLYPGERGSLELAARLAPGAGAFVDIGAHLGYFTLLVWSRTAGTLPIAFVEPDPDLYALLQENVQANGLQDVQGFNVAIGAVDGTGTFYVNRSDALSGSLTDSFADRHDVTPVDVPIRSFANLAAALDLERACVKVDVEGAEWEFMDGASGAWHRVAYLIMEVLGPAHRRGFVRELMRRSGFAAYYVNGYVLEHSADGSFRYCSPEYNWLFCREDPEALSRRIEGSGLQVRP